MLNWTQRARKFIFNDNSSSLVLEKGRNIAFFGYDEDNEEVYCEVAPEDVTVAICKPTSVKNGWLAVFAMDNSGIIDCGNDVKMVLEINGDNYGDLDDLIDILEQNDIILSMTRNMCNSEYLESKDGGEICWMRLDDEEELFLFYFDGDTGFIESDQCDGTFVISGNTICLVREDGEIATIESMNGEDINITLTVKAKYRDGLFDFAENLERCGFEVEIED